MITGLILVILMCIFKTPIEAVSYDTQFIIFAICVISDIHLLALGLKGGK